MMHHQVSYVSQDSTYRYWFLLLISTKQQLEATSIILQLLLLPMTIIGSAIGRIYYEQLCSDNTENNRLRIQQRTIQVGKVVSLISFLPMLFLACGGDKIIILFLGPKWTISGGIAFMSCLLVIPQLFLHNH